MSNDKDHWNSLASEVGAEVPVDEQPDSSTTASETSEVAFSAIETDDSLPEVEAEPAADEESTEQSVSEEPAEEELVSEEPILEESAEEHEEETTQPVAPTGGSHWGSIADELGVDAPAEVFEDPVEEPEPVATTVVESSKPQKRETSNDVRDEFDVSFISDAQDFAETEGDSPSSETDSDEDSDEEIEVSLESDEQEEGESEAEENGEPRRNRRRRRRGKRGRGGRGGDSAAKSDSVDDEDDVESETDDTEEEKPAAKRRGEKRGDKKGDADKAKHRRIPTWDEAIGVIVQANIDSRSKASSGGRRGRGGRGRGGSRS